MTARLNAGTEHGEDTCVLAREPASGCRRHRGRPCFGDVASVENGLQRTRSGIEQNDRRQVCRQVLRGVRLIDRDELRAEHFRLADIRRHHADKAMPRADLEDRAQRLLRPAPGILRQGALHGVDQVVHREDGAHVVFREQQRHRSSGWWRHVSTRMGAC